MAEAYGGGRDDHGWTDALGIVSGGVSDGRADHENRLPHAWRRARIATWLREIIDGQTKILILEKDRSNYST